MFQRERRGLVVVVVVVVLTLGQMLKQTVFMSLLASQLWCFVLYSSVSLGVKQPGREAHCSPPTSAEIKNAWIYTSTPLYVFMAWYFFQHGDNFDFTLSLIKCKEPGQVSDKALGYGLDDRGFQS
jgi:hypothetical protein